MGDLLAGQTALITGASGGIGQAIVRAFAQEGANLVVHYHRQAEAAQSLAEEVRSLGRRALTVQATVSSAAEVDRLFKAAWSEYGRLDILVNNAGGHKDCFLVVMPEATWEEVLELNLKGVFYCSRAAARIMLKQKRGCIINVSSLSGLTGRFGQTNYAAAKGGVIAFTKSLAQEVGPQGIRVNAIAPGIIETEAQDIPEKYLNLEAIALRRPGQPEEVAQTAVFLASEMASYMTGAVLNVNGGLYM